MPGDLIVGQFVFKRIHQSVFYVVTYVILIVSGLYLMVSIFI